MWFVVRKECFCFVIASFLPKSAGFLFAFPSAVVSLGSVSLISQQQQTTNNKQQTTTIDQTTTTTTAATKALHWHVRRCAGVTIYHHQRQKDKGQEHKSNRQKVRRREDDPEQTHGGGGGACVRAADRCYRRCELSSLSERRLYLVLVWCVGVFTACQPQTQRSCR